MAAVRNRTLKGKPETGDAVQVAGGNPRWQVAGNLPSVIHSVLNSVLHPALNSALYSADPHFPENSFNAAFLNSPWA